MSKVKKPKSKIIGKIDPAFKVIVPEHMKPDPAPRTQVYAITMFAKGHNQTDALQQLGLQNLHGSHIAIREISNEEYEAYEQGQP